MKKCTRCNIEKPKSEFHKNKVSKDGLKSHCKSCSSELKKEYLSKNRDAILKYQKKYRQDNKEKIKALHKKYREANKEKVLKRNRKWQEDNNDYFINYRKNNRDILNTINKKWQKQKKQTDPIFKLKCNIRNRIYSALRDNKDRSSMEYLGCSIDLYKSYLEEKFSKGMSWDNYGEWHIDHIIPLASATNKKELVSLFHYSNTQPLWAEDNLKKADKIT